MRKMRLAWFVGLWAATLCSGCSVAGHWVRNLIVEPAHFDRYSDCLGRKVRDKCLANEAWDEICARDGDVYSRHYYRGFVDGFTDYLDAGGTGEPPPVPPRSYWRLYYQTPEGHDAIGDWFVGFRHGADVARASGVRELVVIPVSSIPPKELSADPTQGPGPAALEKPPEATPAPMPAPKPEIKEGPTPAPPPVKKTANGKPMPPPTPPILPVERMIAPPVPKSNQR
jgi:hypothetical protein